MPEQNKQLESILEILDALKAVSNNLYLKNMARFSINSDGALGTPVHEIRKISGGIVQSKGLALKLWSSGIHEAMILSTIVFPSNELTMPVAEKMVNKIESWDICDHFAGNLLANSHIFSQAIEKWHSREEEFVQRSAFSIIAQLDVAEFQKEDTVEYYLNCIRTSALDERNFVKKAVCWALRVIGKSSRENHASAMKLARELEKLESKSAKWIAGTTIKELDSEKVKTRVLRNP